MLTNEEYITDPALCPVCGMDQSDADGFGDWESEGFYPNAESGPESVVTQERSCTDCGAEWYDVYHLRGFQLIEREREQ